ncbi:hypothetical protein EDB89DRAFT_2069043 [Lactarius sanguifluus]|nr:hypothetical protein EDB89DRAFT_2069043 [Lactarius sanguifluus]
MGISTPNSPQYDPWLSKGESLAAVNEWLSAYSLNVTVLSSFRLDPFRYNYVSRKRTLISHFSSSSDDIGPPIFGYLAKIVPAANLPLQMNAHLATSPGRSSSRSPNKLAVSSSSFKFVSGLISGDSSRPSATFTSQKIDD